MKFCNLFVICGRVLFSSVLAIGDGSAMGLYDVPFCVYFWSSKWEGFCLI